MTGSLINFSINFYSKVFILKCVIFCQMKYTDQCYGLIFCAKLVQMLCCFYSVVLVLPGIIRIKTLNKNIKTFVFSCWQCEQLLIGAFITLSKSSFFFYLQEIMFCCCQCHWVSKVHSYMHFLKSLTEKQFILPMWKHWTFKQVMDICASQEFLNK